MGYGRRCFIESGLGRGKSIDLTHALPLLGTDAALKDDVPDTVLRNRAGHIRGGAAIVHERIGATSRRIHPMQRVDTGCREDDGVRVELVDLDHVDLGTDVRRQPIRVSCERKWPHTCTDEHGDDMTANVSCRSSDGYTHDDFLSSRSIAQPFRR